MADTLEDGRLVVVDADQHTGYHVNECVQDAVHRFLIDPRGTRRRDRVLSDTMVHEHAGTGGREEPVDDALGGPHVDAGELQPLLPARRTGRHHDVGFLDREFPRDELDDGVVGPFADSDGTATRIFDASPCRPTTSVRPAPGET